MEPIIDHHKIKLLRFYYFEENLKKMKNKFLLVLAISGLLAVTACKKRNLDIDGDVYGCMDSLSLNFNPDATLDDGSCEYPDVYLPLAPGNTWDLATTFTFLTQNIDIFYNIEMTKDTTIDGMDYVISEEAMSAGSFINETTRYAYRQDPDGNVYRIDLSDQDLITSKILSYPLEIGNSWYDTEAQDNILCEVIGITQVSVPAGTFSDVSEIKYTVLDNAQESRIYYAKDVGIIKVSIEIDLSMLGQGNISLEPELESYNIVN